jgi:DNA-binding Lrp family transcriptional regulator
MDRIDYQILALLQKNARLSNKQLAAGAGLAESTCLQRVRKLEADGIILGYQTKVDPKAMGVDLEAMIAIKLKQHSRDGLLALYSYIQTIPEVLTAYYTSGETDLLA